MALIGNTDVLTETEISGWVADSDDFSRPLFVNLYANAVHIARLAACISRPDLQRLGYGDGNKGFFFDISRYLHPGINAVRVCHADVDLPLPNGIGELIGIHTVQDFDLVPTAHSQRLFALSQNRWKGTELDPGLTWGQIFTGDSFIDMVQRKHTFSTRDHIVEIGPGYGRLLKTLYSRGLPFRQYTAVELSATRVDKLRADFPDDRVTFIRGDVNNVVIPEPADLVICSATFEHLFPSCIGGLRHLSQHVLRSNGVVCIDFIQADDSMEHRQQGFEADGYAFVRVYSANELKDLFAQAGYYEVTLTTIILGKAAFGDVRRIFVTAKGSRKNNNSLLI